MHLVVHIGVAIDARAWLTRCASLPYLPYMLYAHEALLEVMSLIYVESFCSFHVKMQLMVHPCIATDAVCGCGISLLTSYTCAVVMPAHIFVSLSPNV